MLMQKYKLTQQYFGGIGTWNNQYSYLCSLHVHLITTLALKFGSKILMLQLLHTKRLHTTSTNTPLQASVWFFNGIP